MDKLDFLDSPQGEPETVAPAVEPQVEAEHIEPQGPARGPDGRFVGQAEEQAPAEPELLPAEQPAPPVEDERYARLEAQVAGLTKALTATRQQNRQPQPPAPDLYEDPEGHAQHLAQQYQSQMLVQRNEFSYRLAEKTHGEEVAKQVHEWAFAKCDADPIFNQRMGASPDPYEVAVQEWKREQVLEKLQPADLDKLMALLNGQAPAQPTPPAVVVRPPQQPSPPPRSMASAPNAGGAKPGAMPVGPSVAFDSVFKE
jgi:hypothetical protein